MNAAFRGVLVAGRDSLGVDDETTSETGTQSLLARLGAAMTGIAVMAIVSMLASVIIAQTATGDAEAINKAGTLRMQAYRLAEAVRAGDSDQRITAHATSFAETLAAPALVTMIPEAESHPLRQRYEALRARWQSELASAVTAADSSARRDYVAAVPGFVSDIDAMVDALETAASERIRLLQFGQGIALFITIALIFFTLYRLVTEVLPGVRELLRVVQAAQRGDLSHRTSYRGDDEIGALARTFNSMAENLQAMYRQLEDRVADKTRRLSQSNNALQVLYDTAHRTALGADQAADWVPIVTEIEDRLSTGPIVLTLAETGGGPVSRVTRDGVETELQAGAATHAGLAPDDALQRTRKRDDGGLRIPIADGNDRYGVLDVASTGGALTESQRQLTETVADHIATALARARREAERRRLALMEERSAIARELHDSLAQSLSYLKIQTTRVERELGASATDDARRAMDELRQGLNSAYRQLRELLNTFRLQLAHRGLREALEAAVTEFSERGDIPIELRWDAANDLLNPNEELHIVQIVREALTNVIQHAEAGSACVGVNGGANELTVSIADDGRGTATTTDDYQQHGMTIMRDRAQSLGSELTVTAATSGGTLIELTFQPSQSERTTTQGGR